MGRILVQILWWNNSSTPTKIRYVICPLKGAISKVAFQPSFLKGHLSFRVNTRIFHLYFGVFHGLGDNWPWTLRLWVDLFLLRISFGLFNGWLQICPQQTFSETFAALRWVPSAASKFMSRVWFWWIGPNLSQPWIQPGLFSTGRNDVFFGWVHNLEVAKVGALFFKAALLLVLGAPSCLKKWDTWRSTNGTIEQWKKGPLVV